LTAEVGVEAGVGMFSLSLSENGLDDNLLLILVDDELISLLIKAFLIFCFSVTEHQLAEFTGLLFVVVGSYLIKPKTHRLCVVFTLLGIFLVLLCFFFELHDHLIFFLSPSGSVLVLLARTVVGSLAHVLLLHSTHTFAVSSLATAITSVILVVIPTLRARVILATLASASIFVSIAARLSLELVNI
jgi:hypothetical protein